MARVFVVVMAGQSNLFGLRSTYATDSAPDAYPITLGSDFDTTPDDAFYWNKVNQSNAVQHTDTGAWDPLVLGVGFNNPPGVPGPADPNVADAIGPEMQLHHRLKQDSEIDGDLYYVKCCLGGSELGLEGAQQDWSPLSDGELFDLFRDFYWKPAIQAIYAAGDEPFLVGVFWAQGAADAQTDLGLAYRNNLILFYEAINDVLGVQQATWAIQRETILDGPSHPRLQEVRTAQMEACDALSRMHWFNSDQRTVRNRQLFLQSDGEHFTGDGQIDMGNGAADLLIRGIRRNTMRRIPNVV